MYSYKKIKENKNCFLFGSKNYRCHLKRLIFRNYYLICYATFLNPHNISIIFIYISIKKSIHSYVYKYVYMHLLILLL